MPASTFLTHLACSVCEQEHDASIPQTVSTCHQRPLLARYDLEGAKDEGAARLFDDTPSMWRYARLLPGAGPLGPVSLGEGWTPLLPAGRLGDQLGLPNLLLKDEAQNPTGSFKARGMSAAVTRARALGLETLSVPTAGNAGGALAAYAARAGLHATIAMPRDAPQANLSEVRAAGAELVQVSGLITDCAAYLRERRPTTGAFDMSTLKEPYRLEGKKTMGYELWQQLEGLPDVIVYPTGGGTGLIGMWKAFDELETLGLIGNERPRMVSVQSEGCAPIVRAFKQGKEEAEPWQDADTIAGGLRVPQAIGDRLILQTLRASGGQAVAVPDAEIRQAMGTIAKTTGALVSPEAAATVPAVRRLQEDSSLDPAEQVVLFLTGSGYKHMDLFGG